MVKPDEDKNGRIKLSPLGAESNKTLRATTAQGPKAQDPGCKNLY